MTTYADATNFYHDFLDIGTHRPQIPEGSEPHTDKWLAEQSAYLLALTKEKLIGNFKDLGQGMCIFSRIKIYVRRSPDDQVVGYSLV